MIKNYFYAMKPRAVKILTFWWITPKMNQRNEDKCRPMFPKLLIAAEAHFF